MLLATGNYTVASVCSSCFFLSGFKVGFVATWKASCGKLWDCFTRYTNPQLVVRCEQILCVTSCEFDEWAGKPKFIAQSTPALYCSQQVDHARWKTRDISQFESFYIAGIYIVAALKAATYGFLFSYSAAYRTQRRTYSCFCSAKFELRCIVDKEPPK